MANTTRFDDVPFGEYDTTPGTERFPDGWYDGLVRELKNAGEKDNRKNVKIVVDLDDLPTVQRTMGIAWGTKDGEPAAWVTFLSSIMRKAVGDPTLRAATPKSVRGRRAAFKMKWSERGFMDIIDFGEEGHRGGRRRTYEAPANADAARHNEGEQTRQHDREPREQSRAVAEQHARPAATGERPRERSQQQQPNARAAATDRPAERAGQGTGLRVVGGGGGGVDPKLRERYSPGQLRVVIVGTSLGMSLDDVLDYVEREFHTALEQIEDSQVAAITTAMRDSKKVAAAS